MVTIDAIEETRRIIGQQLDINTDFLHCLRIIFSPELSIFAPWSRTMPQFEADAIGSGWIASFIQQCFGFFYVIFINADIVSIVGSAAAGDRAASGFGIATHDRVDGKINIKPVIDGLPNLQIGQNWITPVKFNGRMRNIVFETLSAGIKTTIFLQPLSIRHRNAIKCSLHHFFGFERRGGGGFIWNKAPDNTVEIWILLSAPIIVIALSNDVLAPLILHKLKRTRADWRGIIFILENIGAFIKMLGHWMTKIRHRSDQQIERHRF